MNLNIVGIFLNLAGLLVLFRYGMPFRVATAGATYIVADAVDEKEVALDKKYTNLGYVGLALAVIGALLQAWAAWT